MRIARIPVADAAYPAVDYDEAGERRIDVFGVRVSATNPAAAARAIDKAIETGQHGYVCVTGAHGIVESQRDSHLRTIHNEAYLVVPDGVPLVWMLRWAGARGVARVYGPDLMPAVISQGVKRAQSGTAYRHFLYGSTETTLKLLKQRIAAQFPEAQIVGTYSPPFRPLRDDEVPDVARRINAAAPHIVWIGLSTPLQERWARQFRPLLDANLLIAVGAAFDIQAGVRRRAPRFMQRAGLEWTFRLVLEPRRLWRRYSDVVPRFIYLAAKEILRGRRSS